MGWSVACTKGWCYRVTVAVDETDAIDTSILSDDCFIIQKYSELFICNHGGPYNSIVVHLLTNSVFAHSKLF